MRAWHIEGSFGIENLRLVDLPDPIPGPHQARVRVSACSLNYRDLLVVGGQYNPKQRLPLVPLSDGVGVVDAIGPGVERVAVGDRVAGAFATRWIAGEPTRDRLASALGSPHDGMARTHAVLDAEALVHVPPHLSDEQAAALPCAGVTAWCALFEEGRVRSGDFVLVQGTGGVSIFALQLAALAGARVIVTSSSDDKLARARELGAWQTINYRTEPQWSKAARAMTGGAGVDHVVEVGGAGTIEQSIAAVRPGGTISVIGVLAGGAGPLPLVRLLMQQIRLQGVHVGSRESFERLARAVQSRSLVPVVDRVFAFAELPAALEHMRKGAHFGKIALRVAA